MVIIICGYDVLIDDEDFERVNNIRWYANKAKDKIYFCKRYGRYGTKAFRRLYLHRLIVNAPKNKIVDHHNRNTLDNRKCNLRVCSYAENNRNSKIKNTNVCGYKGVGIYKNKWIARIRVNYKVIHLGYFDTPEEAYAAYCEASKKYHKEYGRVV